MSFSSQERPTRTKRNNNEEPQSTLVCFVDVLALKKVFWPQEDTSAQFEDREEFWHSDGNKTVADRNGTFHARDQPHLSNRERRNGSLEDRLQ